MLGVDNEENNWFPLAFWVLLEFHIDCTASLYRVVYFEDLNDELNGP